MKHNITPAKCNICYFIDRIKLTDEKDNMNYAELKLFYTLYTKAIFILKDKEVMDLVDLIIYDVDKQSIDKIIEDFNIEKLNKKYCIKLLKENYYKHLIVKNDDEEKYKVLIEDKESGETLYFKNYSEVIKKLKLRDSEFYYNIKKKNNHEKYKLL